MVFGMTFSLGLVLVELKVATIALIDDDPDATILPQDVLTQAQSDPIMV
jgi:hypothetical protein